MAHNTAETLIGALVLAVAGGFLVYAANTADVDVSGGGYGLTAEFRRAEGIAPGGDVRIAGVKVGTIRAMTLDPKSYKAVVAMTIRAGIEIPEDTAAKITSASLLGDSFIALAPGASDVMLADGESFLYTQDSVSLIDLATKAVAGSGLTGE